MNLRVNTPAFLNAFSACAPKIKFLLIELDDFVSEDFSILQTTLDPFNMLKLCTGLAHFSLCAREVFAILQAVPTSLLTFTTTLISKREAFTSDYSQKTIPRSIVGARLYMVPLPVSERSYRVAVHRDVFFAIREEIKRLSSDLGIEWELLAKEEGMRYIDYWEDFRVKLA